MLIMDLSVANQSCYNKDVKNIAQTVEQKPVSNNTPVETSDKIDSKSITDDKITLASYRQQNDYFQNETESCKMVEDVWHSFNAFQRTIADVDENDKWLSSASYDHTSVMVKSKNSCSFPVNTTSNQIFSMSETSTLCGSFSESKTACSTTSTLCNLAVQTKFNAGISASKTLTSSSLPTLSSSKQYVSAFETDCRRPLESNNHSPSNKSSNSILKCTREMVPSITNMVGTSNNLLPYTLDPTIHVREHHDKDVKASGIISTQFLPTMEPSTFGTTTIPKFKNSTNLRLEKRRIHRDIFSEDDDWDIYQPGIIRSESVPTTESSSESHFVLGRWGQSPEKCLSKNNLISFIDYDARQRTSPYIRPVTGSSRSSSSVNKGITFLEYNKGRMLKEVQAYFLENPIQVTGNINDLELKKWIISAPYFSKNFALTHGLNLPTTTPIQESNFLEELKKENEPIQDEELANDVYEEYLGACLINEQLRERFINIRSKFLPQNQAGSTSDVISKDILVSPTYADNISCPRTTSQTCVIKPLGINTSNSYNADCEIKALPKVLKTNDSSTDLSKVESMKSDDIWGANSKKCPSLLQSTNQDN